MQARIREAFADLKVSSFAECVSKTSPWCSSGLPDEDACLVQVAPDELQRYVALHGAAPPPGRNFSSAAVNHFYAGHQKQFSPVFVEAPDQSLRERYIYSDADRSLAILLSKDVRCFDISEITSASAP